jgi:succinate dehydrogenase/fumarate reductase-like Fe-S protein
MLPDFGGINMQVKSIKTKVFRFNPRQDQDPFFQEYDVPWEPGMTAMDVLDYIYQNLDSTLAYYDHAACKLGICARCTGRVNGKPGLLCQAEVSENMVIEPSSDKNIVRDLVFERANKKSEVT